MADVLDKYAASESLTPARVSWNDVNAPGAFTTIKRTGGQMLGGIGEAYGDMTGNRDNWAADTAEDIVARNPSGINSLQDVWDKPGLAAAEAGANALTFLIPYLGAGKVMQLMNAGRVATTATQAALAGVPSLGEIGESQRETGSENLALKYGGAGLVGLIENLGGMQRLLGPKYGKGMTEAVGREVVAASPVKTFMQQWGRMGLEEGAEELAQTPIEQYAGGKPLGGEEMALGGVMGALGGLVLGPLGAGARHSQASKLTRQIDDARDTLAQPIVDAQSMSLHAQASRFLEGVTNNDFGLQAAETMAAQNVASRQTANDSILTDIADTTYGSELGQEQAQLREQTLEDLKSRLEESRNASTSAAARERTASLGEDIVTAAPVVGEGSPLPDIIETLAIEGMVAKDEAAKAEAEAKNTALSQLLLGLTQQRNAQQEQQAALLSGAQPDMFPDAGLQGPSQLPALPQFDAQDQLRAALTNMQVIPLAAQTPTPDLNFGALARLAEDLKTITDRPVPLTEGMKFASPEGKRATTPMQEMKSRGTPAIANLGLAQGTTEITPLLTEGGKPRAEAKRTPLQPMILEDLAVDLTQRIDNAVVAQEVTPEIGTALKDEVAGLDTNDYNKFKAVRTKFETLREVTNGATRSAPPVVAESPAQEDSDAGGGVDVARATGSQPDAGVQPRTAGGLVAGNEPPVSVADTVTPPVTEEATALDPYAAGTKAAKDGLIIDSNPHEAKSVEAEEWARGWLDTTHPTSKTTTATAPEVKQATKTPKAPPKVATPVAQDNEADAVKALATISALPGRTLGSKKARLQVELETEGAFTDSMSPVKAVEFTNEKIRAYEVMRKACLGG